MRPFAIGPSRTRPGDRLWWLTRQVADYLERERLRVQIRAVLGVDDETARQLAKDFDAQDVVDAVALGWKPGECSPRLFVLANTPAW